MSRYVVSLTHNLDKRSSEEISAQNSLRPESEVAKDRSSYIRLVDEGFIAGQRIAKISVITLISIGIVELLMGHISGSVVATADGVDSMSDAMISFIVLIGLRFARRPADRKFQFGYHKVESFAALIAAIGMIVIGSFIVYHSYEGFIHPEEIKQPLLTMVVLAIAGGISLHRAFQMRSIANKYHLLSLKQSSLILVDAWHNPISVDYIKKLLEEKIEVGVNVRSIKLRQTGIVSRAEIHVEIDGNKPLTEVEMLMQNTEKVIKSNIPNMGVVVVVPHAKYK